MHFYYAYHLPGRPVGHMLLICVEEVCSQNFIMEVKSRETLSSSRKLRKTEMGLTNFSFYVQVLLFDVYILWEGGRMYSVVM
jgi:hypothetical protein